MPKKNMNQTIKKEKMIKKLSIFISIILICLITFIFLFKKEHNYLLSYNINDFEIKENYQKANHKYYFTINNDELTFNLVLNDHYLSERKLIKEIELTTNDNLNCLSIKGDLKFYNVCESKDEYLNYYTITNSNINNTYDKINIYDLNNHKYLIWNYKGFYYLGDSNKKINLFQKDTYIPYLATMVNNVLFIPEYNDNYLFNKYYLIDENGKVKDYQLSKDIYYDSIIKGTNNNSLFIQDNKEDKNYEINIKKNKIRTNNNPNIKVKNDFYYIDNYLYYKNEDMIIKITSDVTSIVYQNNEEIYYLNKDELIYYSLFNGFKKIMKYNEWQFNSKNTIFIFE